MEMAKIYAHPDFYNFISNEIDIEKEKAKLEAIMDSEQFYAVDKIISSQPIQKQSAFLGTVYEAALYGSDFSSVKTIEDIGDIYAKYIIERNLSE